MRRIIVAGGVVIAMALAALPFRYLHSPEAAAPAIVADAGGQPAGSPVEPARPAPTFRRLLIDTSGVAPDACFRFSDALDRRAEAHYEDYVRVEPRISPALRVTDTDLCLGGLVYGTSYKVTLARGLPALSGARSEREETVEVSLGDRPPQVALAGDGFILPRAASNGLTIQTVNVERVTVRVLRMSDRLLPSKVRQTGHWSDVQALSIRQVTRYQIRELLRDSASLVWSGTMAVEADHNRPVQTAFPLSEIVTPGRSGAYLVIAENAATATPERFFTAPPRNRDDEGYDQLWASVPAHWVIATDIALTTLSGADGLHVFARSLASADPLPGVKLSLLATGQDVLGEATTDAAGEASFAAGLLRGTGANAPSALVAYGASDFTLLDLGRAAFDLSDRGVAGGPAAGAVEAFLYTERGIYRPGDTVHVMTLLRDQLGGAVDTLPLTLVLRRPDGVEAKRFALAAHPAGGFRQDLSLSRSAAHGLWSVEALIDPSGSPVGRAQFEVQDFVPQKLKVTLKSAAAALRPGEPIGVALDGQFLYGAPAAGLKGEAELRVVRDAAPVANAKGYRFGLIDEHVDDVVQTLTLAAADAAGHTAIAEPLQRLAPSSAPLKGLLSAGLFEPGGRLVAERLELPIRTQPLLIGIKPRFTDDRAEEGKEALFDILVFDAEGHPVARPGLHWRLLREDRVYDWYRANSSWTWHYHVVDEPLVSGEIDAPAGVPAVLSQAIRWGYYRLVVDDPETHAATSLRFQAGWMASAETADTPDRVEVAVEKSILAPGETTRLRIDGPFAGKAQVTVASDHVFETRQVDVAKDGTDIEVTASAQWGAGAYVLVSLYRPLADGQPHDPVRAVGLAWLAIDPKPRTLSVTLGTPERVTPRHAVAVPVTVAGALGDGPTFVTLAAVDEGILQLTRFNPPDPAQFLFGKRRLGIELRDDYGRLLDGSATRGAIRQGGDAAASGAALGGQGLAVVSTRTVALFSGPVRVDGSGSAQITLDLPDFEGQLHLMAVAYNRGAVGRGDARLTVRDPVVAELALPRFLAPGDHARLALMLHNTEGASGDYHVVLSATGAARIAADHPLDYALGSGERMLDQAEIEGIDEGVGTIAADLSGPGGFTLHRDWQIAVRAPQYPIALEDTAAQAPGEAFAIDAGKLKAFVPGTVHVSLGYSAFAGIDVPSLLQSLYRYPYGCTEQLTSSAFPLIYFNDPGLLGHLPQDRDVKQRVQQSVDTILDRQDAGGQFGLWSAGDGQASPWLNVRAIDFLVHAKEAGFDVPHAALQRGYAWLAEAIKHIGEDNRGYYAHAADATRAYAAYVLARGGRAEIGELRRLHDAAQWSTDAGRVVPASVYWRNDGEDLAPPLSLGQLAGGLLLLGDRARAHSAFALALANLDAASHPRWWSNEYYYTPVRDLAGLIAVAAESGDTPTAAALLDRFRALSPSADQLNTQEKTWLLAAAHALNTDTRGHRLTINREEHAALKLPVAFTPDVAEIAAGYRVVNSGGGILWRTLVVEGAPRQAPSAMDQGYSLNKEYFSLDGTPLDPAHLAQNDRVIVLLSGRVHDNSDHRTVLVDMLPAAWEIETIVKRAEEYAFLGILSKTRLAEARDDRFVAAFDLGDFERGNRRWRVRERDDADFELDRDEFRLAYVARVVTPGHFALPAAVVEDMYRPGVMGRTGAAETIADPR
jgi:alpha-2-macroglobulin